MIVNDKISSLGTYLKIIGIREHAKKNKNKCWPLTKLLRKRISSNQTKHQLRYIINKDLNFWITWNWTGPLKSENNLQVDEKKYKNWKIWNLKIFWKRIKSKTQEYLLKTDSIKKHHSFNLNKEAFETSQHFTTTNRIRKTVKNSKVEKNSERSVEATKKWIFQ